MNSIIPVRQLPYVILLPDMETVVILGRQPAIGLAELESLYGPELIAPVGRGAAGLQLPPSDIAFDRLGGSVKLAKVLNRLQTTSWQEIERYLLDVAPKQQQTIPDGKLTIGISIYGLKVSPHDVSRTGLSIKKAIRQTGRSVRIVPNKATHLSSAQVIHNKLTGENGWELLLIKDGAHTILAQTVKEQDIEAYGARDQARPKRDPRVGMLPPKLAQTLINLCNPSAGATILDPFCGTGVVLQEAALMGLRVYGTDMEPRMIDYTDENLSWLEQTHAVRATKQLEIADATENTWRHGFDYIAAETYLGRPFSHEPDRQTLQQVMSDVDTIHKKFLKNVARQTKAGFLMCLAVPAWHTGSRIHHLKTLDSLEGLGYTRQSFAHVSNEDLIYHRDGQVVGRELVVLKRN